MRSLCVFRPTVVFGCQGGAALATKEDFAAARQRAREACAWYQNYVALLRRLQSGRTPSAVVGFCGQGGVTVGIRRANGVSHGQDIRAQPRYVRKFGAERFSLVDSTDVTELRSARRRTGSFLSFHSPPCKPYSTALMRGVPSEAPLIEQTRDAVREAGGKYVIENVVGAKHDLRHDACLLRGAYFGEAVDRPRLFEANFKIHVDEALKGPGDQLRHHTCLGERRRWRRLDPFGRPCMQDCCGGNLWAVQGDKPLRCTTCECAVAMGMDTDHMDYEGLAQAIPPSYAQYIFGQACMREVADRYSIEPITFDQMLANPERSRRLMKHWIRGAGGDNPNQGVEFSRPTLPQNRPVGEPSLPEPVGPRVALEPRAAPAYAPVHKDKTGDLVAAACWHTVMESEWRELYYSWAGGFDSVTRGGSAWAALSPTKSLEGLSSRPEPRVLEGVNSLLDLSGEQLRERAEELARLAQQVPGTRIATVARGALEEALLRQLGFSLVRRVRKGCPAYATDSEPARLTAGLSFWAVGRVASPSGGVVDYRRAEAAMDPADRSDAAPEPKTAKAARSYAPIPWERERWDIGLPEELDSMMARRGVGIYPAVELGPSEVPFYKWASSEGLLKSIAEADRALAAGAMEYVPASRVPEVLACSTIHPWTIVDQGGGKWRLCHDYSVGTNKVVPTAPFVLPSVWDVAPVVKKTSFFAKYDIRDGFWHVPIGEDSKKRLVVRHPGTGRLIWATRLPFGYIESPRLFCGLTEAVIARLRRRAAGKGIHFYVFVDDALVVGDTEELTREGMQMLEEEFAARGLQWAPHKKRGPCQCIEFLGLLLCNLEGLRGITITEKRLKKLHAEMARWSSLRSGEGQVTAEPREVASLLGKLVFASQVVEGGRQYMQGMLSSFKGLVVDWRRGSVSFNGGPGEKLRLGEGFWRDLEWWSHHLAHRSLAPFVDPRETADAVLTGTDASGWGTGQVLWLDGAREESTLRFTAAEKRRPINWRELLGVLRVCELGGERLRGRTVLIETDNMAAKDAVRKMASKAEDMQELIRRLYAAAERHGFRVRITHTPGEKLDRPDQTSRGDAEEEPRARLNRSLFGEVESRWGGFGSFLGAERELAQRIPSAEPGLPVSTWAHPTISTVGSALRRIQESLVEGMGSHNRALALVPIDESAAWCKMLRYGLVVGRLPAESHSLEMNVLGRWMPAVSHRPTQLVLFPRCAGACVKRLRISLREGMAPVVVPGARGGLRSTVAGEGYVETTDGASLRLPVFPGSFVYSLPEAGGLGGLYQVMEPSAEEAAQEPDAVFCRYALMLMGKASKRFGQRPVFQIDRRHETHLPDPRDLWVVDHLVDDAGASAAGVLSRFIFDFEVANAQIAAAGGAWDGGANGWVMADAEDSTEEEPSAGVTPASVASRRDYSPFVPPVPARDPGDVIGCLGSSYGTVPLSARDSVGESLTAAAAADPYEEVVAGLDDLQLHPRSFGNVPLSQQRPPLWSGPLSLQANAAAPPAAADDSLESAVESLDRLHAEQSATKSGPEGRLEERSFVTRGGEAAGVAGAATQRNQYAGMLCGGCEQPLGLGCEAVSHGHSLVHPGGGCALLLDQRMAAEVLAEQEKALEGTIYYGVYSDEVGASSVYTEWAEVARLMTFESKERYHASYKPCASLEEAQEFVRAATHARATGVALDTSIKGSLVRKVHLGEKLSAGRRDMISRCIAGKCMHARDDGTLTMCRGGCGRGLHMVTCGQLGKGYAALGNFTCVECRLAMLTSDTSTATPKLRETTECTMILEMGQGRETTAAAYAEYTRLEEEYVLGMGYVLDGTLMLPRHNSTCFKNFLSWMVLERERARSLQSVVRMAGSFFTKLGLTDFTKLGEVRAHLKELMEENGLESEPATAATPRMLKLIVDPGGLADQRYGTGSYLASKNKLQFVMEGVGGCRICEVAGDAHGVLANNTCVMEDLDGERGALGTIVAEALLEHSKTGFRRYLNMAGTTLTSDLQVARIFQEFWRAAGWTEANRMLTTVVKANVRITRPDAWVIRVSLLGLDGEGISKFISVLKRSRCPQVMDQARQTEIAARRRDAASGVGSQQKKYVNVVMMAGSDPELDAVQMYFKAHGFDASRVPAPLLLTTTGGTRPKVLIQPFSVQSAPGPTKELLEKAHRDANTAAMGPDPDLDTDPRRPCKWSTHSLRRLADSVARRYRHVSGATEAQIDIYFGWNERVLLKAMQVHYASLSIRERMLLACITGYM